MPFFYQSGEQIKRGDHVRLHREAGEIEFVADAADDPNDWYVTEFGGGVMILDPKVFGRLFLPAAGFSADEEELEFVSRGA